MLKHADELKLSLDSTLQELPLWEVEVEVNFLGSELVKPFKDEPLLPGIILTNNRQYVGIVSRRKFFEQMSRPFSLELFFNRPIQRLLGIFQIEKGLVLSETTSIMEANYLALQRSPELVYDPIVVKTASEKYRLLDFHQLLLAHSQIHDLTLSHLQQAQKQSKVVDRDLRDFQHNQIKLLHYENITVLRQIVSSIANEINNPANLLAGKLIHASRYIQQLLQLINLYQQYYPQTTAEIQAVVNQVELDNLTTDLSKLTGSMKVGIDRIKQFIHSLRNFSTDEFEKKAINIHENIDSTLIILQSRLKSTSQGQSITIIKEYGTLPLLECYPGQMNLVFMNIISYAIDALNEGIGANNWEQKGNLSSLTNNQKSTNNHQIPTIKIRTKLVDNYVIIGVADNSYGMTEKVKKEIFEPLFASNESINKVNGLGLSISNEIIVKKHDGKFDCISTLGQGTEFIIKLPVRC